MVGVNYSLKNRRGWNTCDMEEEGYRILGVKVLNRGEEMAQRMG